MQARSEGVWKTELQFGITTNISDTFAAIALKTGIGEELAMGCTALGKKYGGEFAYMFTDIVGAAARSYVGFNGTLSDYAERYTDAALNAGQCPYVALALIPAFMVKKPHGIKAAAARKLAPLAPVAAKIISVLPETVGDKLPVTFLTRELRCTVGMSMTLDALVKTGTADSVELPKPMLKAYKAANAFSVKDCAAKLKETAEKLKDMDKDELLAKLGIKE